MYKALNSFHHLRDHPDTNIILREWLDHFGPLFNITCKQFQIPYETTAERVQYFQYRLVEHVQHLRRIYEQHSGGLILRSGEAWGNMHWAEPKIVTEDGVDFLRQSVYLPYVVGEGGETTLELDAEHHSRNSLYVRLTPYGTRAA